MALEILREAIKHNAKLIEQLHIACNAGDMELLRTLLIELDLNNADLHVAYEEMANYPPPPNDMAGGGGD